MNICEEVMAKRLQFRSVLCLIVLLYVCTFFVILPIFCWNRPFSRYYLKTSRSIEGAIADDVAQGQRADEYFEGLDPKSSLAFHTSALERQTPPTYAIGIVTVKRQSAKYSKYNPRYLTRVVAEFDRLLKAADRHDVVFFVCNAENMPRQHTEAWRLTKYVHVVSKTKSDHTSADTREQEKLDYLFCMSQIETFGAKYSILVQDDAIPYPQFVASLDRLMDSRVENTVVRGQRVPNPEAWAAVKFYFPEKWQGYGNEVFLIRELFSAAIFGGGILLGLFRILCSSNLTWTQTFLIFTSFCIFFGCLLFAIGRPYLLMLRLFSVDLYSLRGAPECCIPAVLYRTKSLPPIREHLKGITCRRQRPLDIEISRFLAGLGEKQYLVMPNLFNHIGMFSSLHENVNSPHLFLG
ncbi:transmembrane protein 246-like [Acanthaster planci]|uniref:Transmembrane protein 246-like n=1 Tax=Acanthaster planci TaxID=133434 RepID=A0A8B7ZGT7_ACAPL|nr:transmembrane protein 246-like [Acanthaster planci]XP_022104080.1 transmembrane protein 246-like [Acanthaster planci]